MSGTNFLQHVVLVKFKPGSTPDQIATMIRGWKALAHSIPSITSISMGKQLNLTRGQGWDYGATVMISNGEEVFTTCMFFNFLHGSADPKACSTRQSS